MEHWTTNGNHSFYSRPHVTIRQREYQLGQWTNDVCVDGKTYTPAVGSEIVHEIAARVARAINGRF